jgi:hypothetical protein
MFVWTFLLKITHTIISQSSADSSWITLYMLVISVRCLFSTFMHEVYINHTMHFLILNTYIEEADTSQPSQEIPCILWNRQVNYHVHKDLLHAPVLSQINPVCGGQSAHSSSKWSLSISHAHQTTYAFLVSRIHDTCPPHLCSRGCGQGQSPVWHFLTCYLWGKELQVIVSRCFEGAAFLWKISKH